MYMDTIKCQLVSCTAGHTSSRKLSLSGTQNHIGTLSSINV